MAEEELARVAAITKRTLGFYREERRSSTVDLGRVMDDVLELYARKLASNGVTVNRSYAENAVILAPEGEMRQIATNLLSNAMDALPGKGGQIAATVERMNDSVVFTFSDDGTGIRDSDVERVFEPFFTTKKDVGNGLGLWVTKTLIEKNGGRIEMKTRTDAEHHGTTFRISFPAASTKPVRTETRVAREARAAD
jgi:signal transduction histidine kinase